jgi:hypothetical protein
MHSGMQFKTVLGDVSYDKKGDITKLDYVMYIWKKDPSGKSHMWSVGSGAARSSDQSRRNKKPADWRAVHWLSIFREPKCFSSHTLI